MERQPQQAETPYLSPVGQTSNNTRCLKGIVSQSNILKIIRYIKPDFIRLSLDWVKDIESNESRTKALSNLLRQLEMKNIQVIAPCTFSAEMKKMFIFSGVSFCQERTTKSA